MHSNNRKRCRLDIIVTTYERHQQLARLLRGITSVEFPEGLDARVYVYDDNPESVLTKELETITYKYSSLITYKRNESNLGQGPNFLSNFQSHIASDYVWVIGDDDQLVVEEVSYCLHKLSTVKPAVLCMGFRQGEDYRYGTEYTEAGLLFDLGKGIESILEFGKAASCIFRCPDIDEFRYVCRDLSDCMYQDKAMALLAFLRCPSEGVLVIPEVAAFGDKSLMTLRYSARVFANLDLLSRKILARRGYSKKEICMYLGSRPLHIVLKFWCSGLLNALVGNNTRYTWKRLLIELGTGWLWAIKSIIGALLDKEGFQK